MCPWTRPTLFALLHHSNFVATAPILLKYHCATVDHHRPYFGLQHACTRFHYHAICASVPAQGNASICSPIIAVASCGEICHVVHHLHLHPSRQEGLGRQPYFYLTSPPVLSPPFVQHHLRHHVFGERVEMEEATTKEVSAHGAQTMASSTINTNITQSTQSARGAPIPKPTYFNVFSTKSVFGNDVEYVNLCGDDEEEPSLTAQFGGTLKNEVDACHQMDGQALQALAENGRMHVSNPSRGPDLRDLLKANDTRNAEEKREAKEAEQPSIMTQVLSTVDDRAPLSKNTPSPKPRKTPSKHMVRDSDTELRSHEIRAQQNDRSKILTTGSLLPRDRTLLSLMTMQKTGGFISSVLGAERSKGLAPEIQGIFPTVSKTSGELDRRSAPQKRKADDNVQEASSSTGFRPGKMTHAVKAARIGFTEPPKTIALATPPPTPLKPSFNDAPSTPCTPTPSTAIIISESEEETLDPLAFSLKPPIWTPWRGSEYQDLATAIATSLLIDKFATEHNRTHADVLSVLDATVLRPLRDVEEAKERAEKGLAQLFALYTDYGTPKRIWAKGSGYEIIGELKDVRLGEVIVVGKSCVEVDQDDDCFEGSTSDQSKRTKKPETVVIPITVLTRSDHQWLYGVLKEDKRKILGKVPRKPRPKALQVDTSTKLTDREREFMQIAKRGAVKRSLTPSPTSSSRSDAIFPDTMSSPSPTRRYSHKT
ncbi:uncharacterized protein BDZ99DRAFT_481544 [Mytilinidion resinicola]|uniref:Uncharacterized protein n=1 Tax=Mytilinidion resinicola TaxID=574789 RepID=A0A6A6Y7L0_9PEZI|nr:uncharacterized protein BDZ99DRAFT_481544 [Mytilinidion resinicola]KAF2803964.1 hypothetical protein BDZ99DRAFT_481544 [Mytilinidion resinicola]